MFKRIYEQFTKNEHKKLLEKKEEMRKGLKLEKLNWHDAILIAFGIK